MSTTDVVRVTRRPEDAALVERRAHRRAEVALVERRARLRAAAAFVVALVALALAVCSAESAPPAGLALTPLWERTLAFEGRGVSNGAMADLDGDGLPEILVWHGAREGPSEVVVLDGADGAEVWRARFSRRSLAVATDLDGDGTSEVVVVCGDELTVLAGADGRSLGRAALRGVFGEIACGEFDGRIGGDIICTSGNARNDTLAVLTGIEPTELWTLSAEVGEGPFARGFTKPAALDTDLDGRDEVVVVENGNRLMCISSLGEVRWSTVLGKCERLMPDGVVSSTPVAADLFGDGAVELAVGCFAGALVIADAVSGEVLDRLQFGADAHEEHLRNPRLPTFLRDVLRSTGEPISELVAVELDGGPGDELVFGCSDGFVYACDPGPARTMWRCDTRETVYERCLLVGRGDGSVPHLMAWDIERTYLVDGRDGSAAQGLPVEGGAATVLAGDLDGSGSTDFVSVGLTDGRVTAWSGAAP